MWRAVSARSDHEHLEGAAVLGAVGHVVHVVTPDKKAGENIKTSLHDFEGDQTYTEKPGHGFALNAGFADVSSADYDALLGYVRAVKKSTKRVYLSFDEWNVWFRTRDGALYTGITNDVARRVAQHQQGRGAKALRAETVAVPVVDLPLGATEDRVAMGWYDVGLQLLRGADR